MLSKFYVKFLCKLGEKRARVAKAKRIAISPLNRRNSYKKILTLCKVSEIRRNGEITILHGNRYLQSE